jgi:hypothetical protein
LQTLEYESEPVVRRVRQKVKAVKEPKWNEPVRKVNVDKGVCEGVVEEELF